MPPAELPVVAIPIAKARLLLKYVAMRPMEGVKKMPPPNPVRTPCVSMRCQNLVETDIRKMPINCSKDPTMSVGTNSPASSNRPLKAPTKKVNQF